MPETARLLNVNDPFAPSENVVGGVCYCVICRINKYDQDATLALTAYNAGEGAVAKYNGVPPYAGTTNYVAKVKRLKKQYEVTLPVNSEG